MICLPKVVNYFCARTVRYSVRVNRPERAGQSARAGSAGRKFGWKNYSDYAECSCILYEYSVILRDYQDFFLNITEYLLI